MSTGTRPMICVAFGTLGHDRAHSTPPRSASPPKICGKRFFIEKLIIDVQKSCITLSQIQVVDAC